MPKRSKAPVDNGNEEVTRPPHIARLYARLSGMVALAVAAMVGTRKELDIKDTEFVKDIVATYLTEEIEAAEKYPAVVPDIMIGYSIWCPEKGYGIGYPMMYESIEEAKEALFNAGLFPLRGSWRFVKVAIRRLPEESNGLS